MARPAVFGRLCRLGSRDREPLFGLDRKAVRCAARRRSVVESVARSAARPVAQFPVRLSRRRRRWRHGAGAARLRRLCVFSARLFCLQDGIAVRLFELLARLRWRAAEVLSVVRHRPSGAPRPAPPEQKAETTSAAPAAAPPPPSNLLQQMLGQQAAAPEPAPAPAVAATPAPKRSGPPSSFSAYLRDVGDVVQSGAVRVAATDDNTDFYTVPLTQEALRPGTVYADPYGHVLMLVRLCRKPTVRPAFSSPSTPSPTAP